MDSVTAERQFYPQKGAEGSAEDEDVVGHAGHEVDQCSKLIRDRLDSRRRVERSSVHPGRVTNATAMVRRAIDVVRMTLADLADALRTRGWPGAREELRAAVQFPIFRHGEVLVIEQDLDRVADSPLPEGVTIRLSDSEADWAALATVANRRTRDRFRRASARGRICLIAWRGERPIGYTWLSSRLDPDLETFPLPLPDDALYGWDLYVDPAERRSGVGSALVSARLRHAKALSRRIAWRVIDARNQGSVGTIRNTAGDGARVVGRFRYVRIFGWTRGRVRPYQSDLAAG
jgi:GNAT superfamily N-acetyltransferase